MYYYPKLEDLFVGYECERRVWEPMGEFDPIIDYFCFNPDGSDVDCFLKGTIKAEPYVVRGLDFQTFIDIGNNLQDLRTKYLDKEDIESLGFILTSESDTIYRFEKNSPHQVLIWKKPILHNPHNIVSLLIGQEDKTLCEAFTYPCPSINELRKIIKTLNLD